MNKNLKHKKFIFVGGSGVGKSTLINMILKSYKVAPLHFSVSSTTREIRDGEIDGKHYNFESVPSFLLMQEQDLFAETNPYAGGDYYGTLKSQVEIPNVTILLDVDVNGARQLKQLYPDAVVIFIAPPSEQELRNRLVFRGDTSAEKIEKRMKQYTEVEVHFAKEADYVVVNDILLNAFSDICSIMFQEMGGEIFAMDGTAASGKGYLSGEVAKAKDGYLLPSGLLYRWFALSLISFESFDQDDLDEIVQDFRESFLVDFKHELHTQKISAEAAKLAKLQMVRDSCRILQMKLAYGNHGKSVIVAEGRDMTTEVFRFADYKFYIDADLMTRAQRRKDQQKNLRLVEEIAAELAKRDQDDMDREISRLYFDKEGGVIHVDNSGTAEDSLKVIFEKAAKDEFGYY